MVQVSKFAVSPISKLPPDARSALCGRAIKNFIADYVVLGGGLVHHFTRLPEGIYRGRSENAVLSGARPIGSQKKFARTEMARDVTKPNIEIDC
jgi:hypothetical protein